MSSRCRYLHGFEHYGKGKGKASISKDSPSKGRKRVAPSSLPEIKETEMRTEKVPRLETPEKVKSDSVDRTEQRTTRLSKQTTPKEPRDVWKDQREPKQPPREIPLLPPPSSSSSSSLSSPSRGQTGREARGDVRSSPRSHGLRELRAELVEDGKRNEKAESPASMLAECKSELSDHESSQVW